MDMDSELDVNPEIFLLDEVKLQARVLVAVLKALRAELGEDRANELVIGALREWSREVYLRVGEFLSGRSRDKWVGLNAQITPRIGEADNYSADATSAAA